MAKLPQVGGGGLPSTLPWGLRAEVWASSLLDRSPQCGRKRQAGRHPSPLLQLRPSGLGLLPLPDHDLGRSSSEAQDLTALRPSGMSPSPGSDFHVQLSEPDPLELRGSVCSHCSLFT